MCVRGGGEDQFQPGRFARIYLGISIIPGTATSPIAIISFFLTGLTLKLSTFRIRDDAKKFKFRQFCPGALDVRQGMVEALRIHLATKQTAWTRSSSRRTSRSLG